MDRKNDLKDSDKVIYPDFIYTSDEDEETQDASEGAKNIHQSFVDKHVYPRLKNLLTTTLLLFLTGGFFVWGIFLTCKSAYHLFKDPRTNMKLLMTGGLILKFLLLTLLSLVAVIFPSLGRQTLDEHDMNQRPWS